MAVNLFDANVYRAANPDLRNFNDAQAWSHFQSFGLNEGRSFSRSIDLNFYRSSNSDLAGLSKRQLFAHLQNFGVREGRDFSALVDLNFYRSANVDLAGFNNEQLFEHLYNNGLREGRRFSSLADLNFYRSANPDLAGFNNEQLFEHLNNYGMQEGRRFSSLADLNFYRSANPDLARFSNKQIFEHLNNNGVREGRRFSSLADLNFYRSANPDLAGFNNEQLLGHLINSGIREGRYFSPLVDLNTYRSANLDLSAAEFDRKQLLDHLASSGLAEGRRFSVSFDSNFYRNTYSDLAGLNNWQLLEHFELNGLNEGRASSVSFNIRYYLDNNSDLRAAGFNHQQAQQHFERYGFREGRLGAAFGQLSIPSTDPGNTLNTAYSLDFFNRSRTITDFVGSADRDDYYRLTLTSTSNLNLSLSRNGSSNSGYANMQLIYDSNGNGLVDSREILESSYASNSGNSSLSSPVGAGTYFIRVYTDYNTYNTYYNLGISATPLSSTTPKDPGNTLNDALDIGTVSSNSSFTDFIGSTDRNDYYRFTLANTSNFNASLTGLTDSANIELIFDSNGNGVADSDDTINYSYGSISISSPLGAGTYFIRVYTNSVSYNTKYTLGITATATPSTTPRDPGNTMATALDIGVLSGRPSFSDFVGITDRDDYYRFSLSSTSNFSLSLDGLSMDADVQLIFGGNYNDSVYAYETIASSSRGGTTVDSINLPLGAGVYYIRVYPFSSSNNTRYTLTLSA